ncbi:MAG: 3-keto-disaccharide hydrolase, partial [Planctomycetaceae bacterium]
IFFRSIQGTADAPSNGYEMQLNNAMKDGDPTQPADSGTGAIFRRVSARRVVASDNQFFTAVLIADGDRLLSWVNGYQVVNWRDERDDDLNPRRGRRLQAGHLILQGHDPGTDVDFRSIRVHSLRE